MAKKSTLREYQTDILARLEEAKKAGAAAPAGYLGVLIGDKHVLVNLQEISESLPILPIQRVPLVKPWFLGVANVRGVLYAINDLALMLEHKLTKISANARVLLISEALTSHVAFMVDSVLGLRNLNELQLRDESIQDMVCLKPQTYIDNENRVWHMLDCDKLVRSKEFATPYAV